MTALGEFLEHCGRAAHERAARPEIAEGAAAFLDALATGVWRDPELRSVPVVAEIEGVTNDELGFDVGAVASSCSWTPSPRSSDEGVEMALCPLNMHVDLGEVVAGLMVVGGGRVYPEHHHEPQELYLVISGEGSWRYGGNDHYETLTPGTTVYNPPGVTHGVRSSAKEPIVAFYALWP